MRPRKRTQLHKEVITIPIRIRRPIRSSHPNSHRCGEQEVPGALLAFAAALARDTFLPRSRGPSNNSYLAPRTRPPQIDAKGGTDSLTPLSWHLGCVSLTTKEAHMHLLSGLDTIHPPQLEVFVLLCGVQTERR